MYISRIKGYINSVEDYEPLPDIENPHQATYCENEKLILCPSAKTLNFYSQDKNFTVLKNRAIKRDQYVVIAQYIPETKNIMMFMKTKVELIDMQGQEVTTYVDKLTK